MSPGCWRVVRRVRGGPSRGSRLHTGVTVSPLTASGHPVWNRAPFDGFKQCLMTRTHLIRLTRLQKFGIKGRGGKQGR